mgnify:CR=1 FL=1
MVLSIDDVKVVEGNGGTTNAVFTVSVSNPSAQSVTVDYQTSDGSATLANADYQAASGTVKIAANTTSSTVTVQVNGDTKFEADETYSIDLSNPVNATIGDGHGVGTISNDDTQPVASIDDVKVVEGNTGTVDAVFTVSLSNTTDQSVTVAYSTSDGTRHGGQQRLRGRDRNGQDRAQDAVGDDHGSRSPATPSSRATTPTPSS